MTPIRTQPTGLYSLCLSVSLERMAYFGLQSVLALYLVDLMTGPSDPGTRIWLLPTVSRLSSTDGMALASVITGLFLSLTALAPVLGGILADRLMGYRRAILLGGAMMATGHGLMSAQEALLLALTCIALGSGLFKGTAAAQLSALYAREDSARVEGFRLFYIAINLAALVAPVVIGTMAQRVAWHAGFATACLVMLAGLGVYARLFPVSPTDTMRSANPGMQADRERPHMRTPQTMALLATAIALTTLTNFQITNAYLLWVDRSFDLLIGAWRVPSSWMIAADGLLSLLALAGSSLFWQRHEQRGGLVGACAKAVIGSGLVAGGTACLVAAVMVHGNSGIPVAWGLAFQLLNSLGLANVLPAVMAMFGQSSDRHRAATAMAGFYLALFAAGLLSTAAAALFTRLGPAQFWALHLLASGLGTACLTILWYRSRRVPSPTFRRASGLTDQVA